MTSRRPSRRASLPSRGRYHSSARISPARDRTPPRAGLLELVARYLPPGFVSGNGRISCVPGEPQLCSCPVLRPRRDRRIRPCNASARPPLCPRRRLPRFVLSGLNHTASALAVYASQAGSPRHHARLASGCWPGSPGRASTRRVPSKGFRVYPTSIPPFPSSTQRKDAIRNSSELCMASPEHAESLG
jgi:hypothetical protein